MYNLSLVAPIWAHIDSEEPVWACGGTLRQFQLSVTAVWEIFRNLPIVATAQYFVPVKQGVTDGPDSSSSPVMCTPSPQFDTLYWWHFGPKISDYLQ